MDGFVRTLTIATLALLVTGCKLAVMVSSEGNVVSSSGTRNCSGPGYCEFAITDSSFSETFTAVPRPGFEFVKWQDGGGFFCAKSTDPVCTVEMPNEDFGDAVVALFLTGSIRPVFSDPGNVVDTDGDGIIDDLDDDDDNDMFPDTSDNCPLDSGFNLSGDCPQIPEEQTVLVADKRWVQPYLISGATWHEINAACPAPSGVCSGKIHAVDVSGWTWASAEDVTALLNTFLDAGLAPPPDRNSWDNPVTLNPDIFNYFQSQLDTNGLFLYGWTRTEANVMEAYIYGADCATYSGDYDGGPAYCFGLSAGAGTENRPYQKDQNGSLWGVWLYRAE